MVNDGFIKVAQWTGNMGMGKPNTGLDFTYYLRVTWYRACAVTILLTKMEIFGPHLYFWKG